MLKSLKLKNIRGFTKKNFIQSSVSPYTSLVLLVKKNDESWRMCVDYRKLNDMIIKNKFPILIIDNLLTELHG
jgi:hypothetical protein